MRVLTPLKDIHVPQGRDDQIYQATLLGRGFSFRGLKRLLAAADLSKSGERGAGLAAADEAEREAARTILAGLTMRHLYERPLRADDGTVDGVMRVNYDIDLAAFEEVADLTVGELRDLLLSASGDAVARTGGGLTGVMAAAVAKIMDVHDLVFAAARISRPSKARTRIGLPGTLSARCQPNHPTDDLSGITLLLYAGLSMGTGDCLLGVNPSVDSADNVSAVLRQLDAVRRDVGAPTQICVLAHVKTQLAAMARGAPVEIVFQSLAGTERTCIEEFDITVDLLDRAYKTVHTDGPLAGQGEQLMYFETGQGSEYSYGKHNGIDMCVCEALCYGLARRYDPFMVNNVTGFIGPETHLDDTEMIVSNLQDHFMGKLLGLPMGMAPCYTLHSDITPEGQQIATQLATAAGSNFFMDVFLTIDRMLAYFDTSGHDDQTLREVYGRRPAPEFAAWAVERGIFVEDDGRLVRGPAWGDPRQFCASAAEFRRLLGSVPAAYGFETAGPRPASPIARRVRANLAIGREAIHADLDPVRLGLASWRLVPTMAVDKQAHLSDPTLGARLSPERVELLEAEPADVQIIVSDGLSADAVHHNVPELVPILLDGLASAGASVGRPVVAPLGRVKLIEAVGDVTRCALVILLIGERPGGDAIASRSMSAYFGYRVPEEARRAAAESAGGSDVSYEYTVVSNIHPGGLPAVEAGSVLVETAAQILRHQAAGNRLEAILGGA